MSLTREQRRDSARQQLRNRGYRRLQTKRAGNGTDRDLFEFWVPSTETRGGLHAPTVWLALIGEGWDLFVQADASNDVDRTWAALDVRLDQAREEETMS